MTQTIGTLSFFALTTVIVGVIYALHRRRDEEIERDAGGGDDHAEGLRVRTTTEWERRFDTNEASQSAQIDRELWLASMDRSKHDPDMARRLALFIRQQQADPLYGLPTLETRPWDGDEQDERYTYE